MVLLLDFDDEDGASSQPSDPNAASASQRASTHSVTTSNGLKGIVRALACFPVATSLADGLDLTDIHELSRTCWPVRLALLAMRSSMIGHALKCHNDPAVKYRKQQQQQQQQQQQADLTSSHGQLTPPHTPTSRVGPCARDMVAACRRCGVTVCRNCVSKLLTPAALKLRYRRLCKTCQKCRINDLTSSTTIPAHAVHVGSPIARSPCTCVQSVWICYPCGLSLRTLDVQYFRVWSWRERYSTYVGGMSTGIGEGLEGEECGRKTACLAAQDVEKEIECDASELAADSVESERAKLLGRSWSGASYHVQEVEGLGGILKKKVRRRIRVGQSVREYDDERRKGTWLAREQTGQNRSWCSWCDRVVPSNKDERKALETTVTNKADMNIPD